MADQQSFDEFDDGAGSSVGEPATDEVSGPPSATRHRIRTGLVLALGAGLALAAGGVALAQNDPSPKPSASPEGSAPDHGFRLRGPLPFGDPLGGPLLDGSFLGAVGPALHGEVTIKKDSGGYETLRLQRGTVTDVSHDSLTVKSEDGYTQTYAVTGDSLVDGGRDGIGSIKNAHEVGVTAVVNGGTTQLRQVIDTTLIKKHLKDLDIPAHPWLKMRGHIRDRLHEWLDEHMPGQTSDNGSNTVYTS